ncbi:hypothetical protein OG233_01540 [Streptomyces sp. NBC_01218]|uniref:hypothetical protein n=1 Tax=Streptomyces sp. NBC_01218 TaxID=2903780 RepID=UPI002E127538|nr:hypothetical protein OG233_01540 [Streptomyces sp. NBC_01218]
MTAEALLDRESFRRLLPISMPRSLSQLPDRVWADEEWDRIQRGYRARDMDEKWNVFVEGDVLFAHRSWTGHGIYEVSFTPVTGGGRRITSAVVEADAKRHRRVNDEYDCRMVELVVSAIVLGEPAADLVAGLMESTARASGKSDLPGALVAHSVLGLRSES